MIPTINHNETILEPLKKHEECIERKPHTDPCVNIVASIKNSIQNLALIKDKITSLEEIKDNVVQASKINMTEVMTLIVLLEKFNNDNTLEILSKFNFNERDLKAIKEVSGSLASINSLVTEKISNGEHPHKAIVILYIRKFYF